jgi:hypothetical protein
VGNAVSLNAASCMGTSLYGADKKNAAQAETPANTFPSIIKSS